METTLSQDLRNLANAYGIQPEWQDIWGNVHHIDAPVYQSLLSAMDVPAKTDDDVRQSLLDVQKATVARWLPPVLVLPESEERAYIFINIPASQCSKTFNWTLRPEEGEEGDFRRGSWTVQDLQHKGDFHVDPMPEHIAQFEFILEGLPPQGYHRFTLSDSETDEAVDMLLVVTPTRCFISPVLEADNNEGRIWGTAVQLYAAHSNQSWGVGDYGDLQKIIDWCGDQGASIIGLNPLHALFPHNAAHSSPYSPSSRMFFNALLLNIEMMQDFQECDDLREKASAPEFHSLLNTMRAEALIPYNEVGRLKYDILDKLYQHFRAEHIEKNTRRSAEFNLYVTDRGPLLASFALYHALQEHFYAQDPMMWGWPVWPEEYRDPNSDAVVQFKEKHADRVAYYEYLQWQTELQLAEASKRCKEKSLSVGLYMDMAVGVDRSGADVWANQSLFAQSSAVGAPPDEYNQKGQDWGLPPLIPERMREEQYRSFIQILRQNMRHAGALRMDHVMGLMRLYWIPPGLPPSEGAYIHYAVDELFGILALESQRNKCLIIGEDMGTVPEIVRDRMERWGVYSYKVFFFEKENEEQFKNPEFFQDTAAIAVSTHDLPTLAGFWQSRDITVRTELDLYPTEELRERQVRERALERVGIMNSLSHHELLPAGMIPDPGTVPVMTHDLALAIHRYVSRTKSKVFMVQFEDLLLQNEQINLPGTTEPVYPCWRRRLTMPLDTMLNDPIVLSIANAIAEERPLPAGFGAKAEVATKA